MWLNLLAKDYELVVFSLLPKQLIHQILSKIDNSDTYISQILGYEDIVFLDGYAVKDLSLLSQGR